MQPPGLLCIVHGALTSVPDWAIMQVPASDGDAPSSVLDRVCPYMVCHRTLRRREIARTHLQEVCWHGPSDSFTST